MGVRSVRVNGGLVQFGVVVAFAVSVALLIVFVLV